MVRDGKTWRSEGGDSNIKVGQIRATEGGGTGVKRDYI